MRTRTARGFTLIELLVVITIVVLVSAAVLPAIVPALSQRQISESARILQAALAGARDAAIRAGDIRGVRLMPDPVLTVPSLADATGTGVTTVSVSNAGTRTLAYNRFVAIEPAGDYKEGHVSFSGINLNGTATTHPIPPFPPGPTNTPPTTTASWNTPTGLPPNYPWPSPGITAGSAVYPCYQTSNPNPPPSGTVLMIEQELFVGGPPSPSTATIPPPNAPTTWYWNIRIGDKIRISDAGRFYTVVGPMNVTNPELFVNVGPPGTPSPLVRSWTYLNGTITTGQVAVYPNPEFLFVVNGQDDNNDGFVDNGWDGVDNNNNGVIDDLLEWTEMETVVGTITGDVDQPYTIDRRPVPTRGAREVALPPNIVVDATSWRTTTERSRLPIDPFTLNVDIMVDPGGTVVPSTLYSSPTVPGLSGLQTAFFHFWLTERQDVHELTEMWGVNANGAPNSNPNTGQSYMLPMPLGTLNYSPTNPNLVLKGERRLVTLFTRTGLLTSDSVENFNGNNINLPYVDAQLGLREAK
jgi:prepilin-type N-terminal cleavage/methylation domain-containing protein